MIPSGPSQLAVEIIVDKLKGVLRIAINTMKLLEGLIYKEVLEELKCWSFPPFHHPHLPGTQNRKLLTISM